MIVVVVVAVQVVSVNFVLQSRGLLFCPHNVLVVVVVLLGVHLPVFVVCLVSFVVGVRGLLDIGNGAVVVVIAV